jgi:tetratricopeptide (TPR) repeat protein
MAVLSKFIGLGLVPLLAVYGWHRQRRAGQWLIALAVPLVLAAAFEATTYSLYGKGLFLTASGVASKARVHGGSLLEKVVVGLSFLGGCYLPLLLFLPYLWSAKRLPIGLCLVLPCLLVFPHLGKYSLLWGMDEKPDWLLFVQSTLLIGSGMHVLLLMGHDLWRHRSASSLFLCLWVVGIFVFAAGLNWTLNGRSLLPMAPAVGILLARRIDERSTPATVARQRWMFWPVVPAIALSLWLVKNDYELAAVGRAAAAESCARYLKPGNTLWFEGHWGFQYYMEAKGAKPLERDFALPNKGDIVVVPSEAVNVFDIPTNLVRLLETLEYQPNLRCSTMSLSAGAGFYSATAGPFPFSLGRIDPERYYVFEVVESREQASQAPGGLSKVGVLAQQFEMERHALEAEAATRHNPDHEGAHFLLAQFHAARGKTQAAADQFSEVLRINPNNGNAHLEFAGLLVRMKQRTQALSHYRAAARLMPESSRAREALDQFLAANKDLQPTGQPDAGSLQR